MSTEQTPKPPKEKKPWVWVEQREVISAMRRVFRKYPPYQEVLARTRVERWIPCTSKKAAGKLKLRVFHVCEKCSVEWPKKTYRVDHIDPVVDPLVGFSGYNIYAVRLYCPLSNLQGLCDICHKAKSKGENAVRAKTRKERKDGNGKRDSQAGS